MVDLESRDNCPWQAIYNNLDISITPEDLPRTQGRFTQPEQVETPRAVRLKLSIPSSTFMLVGKSITQAEEAACRKA